MVKNRFPNVSSDAVTAQGKGNGFAPGAPLGRICNRMKSEAQSIVDEDGCLPSRVRSVGADEINDTARVRRDC